LETANQSGPPQPIGQQEYNAASITVLEGLEAVRKRPGMYIGPPDDTGLHQLVWEVVDNSVDESLAGYCKNIAVTIHVDNSISVADDGRGIPTETHPTENRPTPEVVLTILHAGGKFDNNSYAVSAGLHGVGVSCVNALAEYLDLEIFRNGKAFTQHYERGVPKTELKVLGPTERRGTTVRFKPDPQIFGEDAAFDPARLFRMTRAKAYLFGGVEIRWTCAKELLRDKEIPASATLHFPGGLKDYLASGLEKTTRVHPEIFAGRTDKKAGHGSAEWAVAFVADADPFISSYCNTIPTHDGGTHESGLRAALFKGLRDHAARMNQEKRASAITSDDVMASACAMISVFIREPEFQGQTKDRLATAEAARIVEQAVRDPFDHWLAGNPTQANKLLDFVIERAEERIRRRQEKEVSRKNAVRKLRLPGKLADCTLTAAQGSEIFIVEGDSAGGSAKQARDRATQAVLPLRGKILNVASAGRDKLAQNQQLADLVQALGAGTGTHYREQDLRYEKVIVMTDADVDGAHIASLLITFFYRQMPKLIEGGHLFLAVPPLYRLTHGGKTLYARDDRHKDILLKKEFHANAKVDIGRFKGLGEMMAAQLKETTMDPKKRTLLKVILADREKNKTAKSVDQLMGTKPEARFAFISERAEFASEQFLDV
jgi:topoisomerase-4 subunit B